jgi:hypothetical protein
MTRGLFVLLVLLWAAAAGAQTHPCDNPYPTPTTYMCIEGPALSVTASTMSEFSFCHDLKNEAGEPITVDRFRLTLNDVPIFDGPLSPVGEPNAAGEYLFTGTLPAPVTLATGGNCHALRAYAIAGTLQSASSAPTLYVVETTPAPDPEPAPEWTFCARENGFCAFTGTKEVRYGANGVYVTRTLTDGTPCTNAVFGDPLPYVTKACDVRDTTAPAPEPPPPPPPPPPPTDTTAPVVSASGVRSGNSSNVTITASATDNTGVMLLEVFVNGTLRSSTSSGSQTTLSVKSTSPLTWIVRAKDAAGNVGEQSGTVRGR